MHSTKALWCSGLCLQHGNLFFSSIVYAVFYTVLFPFIFCVRLYSRLTFLRMCTVIMPVFFFFFFVLVVSHVCKRKESYVVGVSMFLWAYGLLLRPAEECSVLKLFEVVSFNAL